jgi:glycosyltransferase involved in cell wall biosynthesis/O-antigen/teichoic acid export membrane protein
MTASTQATPSGKRLFSVLVGGGGLAFFVASSFANASNFLFHVVMSRILGPATYGALGSLLGLITVVTFAVSALQAAVIQAVAERSSEKAGRPMALRPQMSRAGLAAIASLLIATALSPAFEHFLHLASPVPVILLGVFAALSILTLVPQGVLLGRLSFGVVALSLVAAAIIRLSTGFVLADQGFGLDGALVASVLAAATMLAVLVWPLRHEVCNSSGDPVVMHFTSAALAVAALGGFSALVGVDSFLARHYLSGVESGYYVAAATAARIALFLPSAISLIAFPRFAASRGSGAEARHVLTVSLLAVGGLGAVAASAMLVAPHLLISILFGARYQQAAGPLRVLAVAAAALGLISVFVYFHLARHSRNSTRPWVGVGLATGLIAIWHSDLDSIAWIMLGVTTATLAILGLEALTSVLGSPEEPVHDGPLWRGPEPDLDLTIVVPYFNPGARVRATVEEIVDVLKDLKVAFEIIAVSDGSTDGSEEALVGLAPEVVRCFRLPSNQGKGEALRVGLAMGRGAYLGFIDADGDLPPAVLPDFVRLIATERPDVVLGSKRHPDSEVVYPPLRHLYSWVYQQLVRTLFRLSVHDTQTGVKFIRRDVLADVLARMLEKRFAFDLELLVVARQCGYDHLAELPVRIGARFSSTISLSAVVDMVGDTLAIFYRLRILRFYGPRHQRAVGRSGRASHNPSEGLRILLFNWRDITHPLAGGSEVYAHEICREWASAGHEVTFFTSQHTGTLRSEFLDGVHVIRDGGRFTVYRRARQYYRTEGKGRFDLVVDAVNTRPFSSPRFVKDAPVLGIIYQVAHDVWKYESPFPLALLGRYLLEPHWLRQYADIPVVTISDSSHDSLRDYGLRRLTVVAPGAGDLGRPDERFAREAVPTVLFVGRLAPNKRPGDAIEAFRVLREQLPDTQMWVIGSGRLEAALRDRHIPGVWFLGRVSQEIKTERLARAHAIVATSVREGWGLVITEAAALGTPAIAYDVPGLRDSVTASGGVLVEPNPRALADALAEHLPTWMAGEMPAVAPNGVITWRDVASQILTIARSEFDYPTSVVGRFAGWPLLRPKEAVTSVAQEG